MLVVKKTGLVPVRSLARDGRDGVFGVTPDTARQGVAAGTLELVAIPNGIEVQQVAGPAEAAPEPVPTEDNLVEIPNDWESSHHLARMSLAKKILGGEVPKATDEQKAKGTTTVEIADDIIRAEVQRRAAANHPAN